MLKIGVRVPRQFEDAGEYLADVRALDASGVHSLWLDTAAHEPWMLLAAIATVTGSTRLMVPVRLAESLAPAALEARLTTLSRLSRGRIALALGDVPNGGGAPEGLIAIARRHDCPVMVPARGAEDACAAARWADGAVGFGGAPEHVEAALPPITRVRGETALGQPFELWAPIPTPGSREEWRTLRSAYETAGATGIIVPAEPRLLDLLRNGDEEDDRADLHLAQG